MYVSGEDNTHVLVPNDFLTMNPSNVMCVSDTTEKDKEYQPNVSISNIRQKGC